MLLETPTSSTDALRRISPSGVVSTLATSDCFGDANNLAVDSAGALFVSDSYYHRICRVSATGVVTTFAGSKGASGSDDGAGASARFNSPRGLAVDGAGTLFVADTGNYRIRRITPDGQVTTLAGSTPGAADGAGAAAQFVVIADLDIDGAGGLWVADSNRVRRVTAGGVVTTIAGAWEGGYQDGPVATARFHSLSGIVRDGAGVILGDSGVIRRLEGGTVTTIAGRFAESAYLDGEGSTARFEAPQDIAFEPAGNLLVSDNQSIRRVSPQGAVTTAATSGAKCVASDTQGVLYFTYGHSIRRVDPGGATSLLAGDAYASGSADGVGSAARF